MNEKRERKNAHLRKNGRELNTSARLNKRERHLTKGESHKERVRDVFPLRIVPIVLYMILTSSSMILLCSAHIIIAALLLLFAELLLFEEEESVAEEDSREEQSSAIIEDVDQRRDPNGGEKIRER